ncbi:MAG: transporter substrate-binding domain-containing protein [Anaerolineae bacterium]|jgi:putative glutamine transport system substrate-binding protein
MISGGVGRPARVLTCLFISAVGLLGVLALAGCGPETLNTPQVTPTPSPTPFPAQVPVPSRIRERGALVVGVRYDLPPFCSVTADGTLSGFDLDLARELARRWLGDPDAVHFRQVRSDTAADHLQAGEVDLVLAGMIHTQDREEQVDFGPAYFWDGHAFLVRAADAVSITAPADLVGRPVGTVSGSGAEEVLRASVSFTPTLQAYDDFDQALTALAQGEIDAVADLRRRLVRGLSTVPDTVIVGRHTSAPVAAAYVHDQPGFADLVAFTFWNIFSDGTYDSLYARWFPGDTVPTLNGPPGSAAFSLEAAAGMPPPNDALASIQSGGWLRVGIVSDRWPFAYFDEVGDPAGYEVRLVRALADRWLGDWTAVEFIPGTLEEGLQRVSAGEVDMLIGAVPWTREEMLRVDFSLPIYVTGQGLMARLDTPVEGVSGLAGQTVAAVEGSGSAEVLRKVGQEAGISAVLRSYPTLEDALGALEAGEVVAVLGERRDLLRLSYVTPGVYVTADRLTERPLALALPPGDSDFRDLVNLTLQAMARDGQFGTLYREWFDESPPELEPWPGEPVYPLRIDVTVPSAETVAPSGGE